MDAFFLNEDKHTNNISLLYNKETDSYRLCPLYDMGLSLFADTKVDFPLDKDYFACKEKIVAKPFSRDFDEQLDVANELYGSYLKFDFSASRISDVITELQEKYLLTENDVVNGRVMDTQSENFGEWKIRCVIRLQSIKLSSHFKIM